jgi:5-methylcytosine-specific restriction protein A
MRVRFENDDYIGQIVGYIPPNVIAERGNQTAWIASTAINDIEKDDIGNGDPEYRRRMSGSYVRDAKVRDLVLKRAKGSCEECYEHGFLKADGKVYLETHHVISLSEQGPDMPHNVIALCANDHRRAHYAKNWAELQDKFLAKLSKYKTEN